ncbi:hypothetical protein CARUB_v10027462mg [Capsella rubella]|uniref:Root meristem growth factor 9 n=1 Tax=Capsella rubella TaxID=81985 RepID=R0GPL3_9BRAS|nr:root meristem growth factor 9 [Capsella rubella]EOA14295.1 hypothetical protein CARUB_v10027462mg [Capsella rubella]
MAIRASHYKHLLLALVLILFISCPTQARSLREIVRNNRTLLVVEKAQESRKLKHEGGGGGSDIDGLVDMDYNSANKKRPIHNR